MNKIINAIQIGISYIIVWGIMIYVFSRFNVKYDVLGTPHLFYGDEEI